MRAKALRQAISWPRNAALAACMVPWLSKNFLFSLSDAVDQVQSRERHLHVEVSVLRRDGHAVQEREGWQARVRELLNPRGEDLARAHARARLDRWHSPTLPGHRVHRWLSTLRATSAWLPPRVKACQLRTAFNGWLTSRRMQGNGKCIFGCRAEDSIEHYAFCQSFHHACARKLNLRKPPPECCLDDFLGIAPHAAEPYQTPAMAAAARAIAVYALYRTHNAVRHGAASTASADLFIGFLREATRGHAKALGLVASAFQRPRPE